MGCILISLKFSFLFFYFVYYFCFFSNTFFPPLPLVYIILVFYLKAFSVPFYRKIKLLENSDKNTLNFYTKFVLRIVNFLSNILCIISEHFPFFGDTFNIFLHIAVDIGCWQVANMAYLQGTNSLFEAFINHVRTFSNTYKFFWYSLNSFRQMF